MLWEFDVVTDMWHNCPDIARGLWSSISVIKPCCKSSGFMQWCWMPPLVYLRCTSEHTTPLLRELHWLRVPERIQFRLCVLAYHCVHGTAPAYLSDSLRPTSEIVGRRCLRSANTTTLQVPSTRATLGDRAFPVAAARAWNSLPLETRACSSLLTFRRETKSHLFRQSYGWRGAVYSDSQQTSALNCATVLNLDCCKVPP